MEYQNPYTYCGKKITNIIIFYLFVYMNNLPFVRFDIQDDGYCKASMVINSLNIPYMVIVKVSYTTLIFVQTVYILVTCALNWHECLLFFRFIKPGKVAWHKSRQLYIHLSMNYFRLTVALFSRKPHYYSGVIQLASMFCS